MTDTRSEREWPSELGLDDQPGPAPYLTRAKSDAMVLSVLDRAGYDAAPRAEQRGEQPSRPSKPGLGTGSLAAAVVVGFLSIGSASAAVMWFARSHQEPPSAGSPAVRPARSAKPGASAPRVAASTPALEPSAPLEGAPPTSKPDKLAAHAPEHWLREGNRLRAEQRWNRADEAYAHAAQQAPHSQTAYVARVASAAVRLEHLRDPRGALARYRAALAQEPEGALSEEIRFGIADALRELGNRSAERAALEEFLREHPGSALASQARARLR